MSYTAEEYDIIKSGIEKASQPACMGGGHDVSSCSLSREIRSWEQRTNEIRKSNFVQCRVKELKRYYGRGLLVDSIQELMRESPMPMGEDHH